METTSEEIRDKKATDNGFNIVDSGVEYCKHFTENIDLFIYDISWNNSEWQVNLKQGCGGIYMGFQEIDRFDTFDSALLFAKTLNPDDLEELIDDESEDLE